MGNVGTLALIGGGEWREGCSFDSALVEGAGTDRVVVLPTAAAYERPGRLVEQAEAWFAALGVRVQVVPVFQRSDAGAPEHVEAVRSARFIYLADGSPLHLRSVLKDSALFAALVGAWRDGATVAGSSAGAMVLGDPMVDPRGGAFTLGLGLVGKLAVAPHWETWTGDRARRMAHLAPADVVVAEIEEQTALIRYADGSWEVQGAKHATLTLNGKAIDVAQVGAVVTLPATSRGPVGQEP